MTRMEEQSEPHDSRLVEAAAWNTRLHEAGAGTCEAFEAWMAADPRNATAWRQVREPWKLFGDHATAPEIIAARRAALGRAQAAGRKRWHSSALPGSRIRHALAAGVLLTALGALLWWNLKQGEVYRTQTGERRVVTLTDGSRIALDSLSEVEVRYTQKSRDLVMAKGQALFEVARDAERPFAVLAGQQKIVALGTSFNVDMTGRNLRVTLIEGRVTVLDQSPAPQMVRTASRKASASLGAHRAGRGIDLAVGQQLAIAADAAPSVATVNLERATAWQKGQLVFENEPLSAVVARVNHYSKRPLQVEDVRTAQLRISGVFNTGDVEGFVETLTHFLPLQARHDEDGAILLMPR